MSNHKFGIIIPARFGSQRFPGKPLAEIGGIPMIVHTYNSAKKSSPTFGPVVATDDDRIAHVCESFNIPVILTSPDCPSGTDRLQEAVEKLGWDVEIVVNIQGDEPFIQVEQIHKLIELFNNSATQISTLKKRIGKNKLLENSNIVKVITDLNNRAIYFSRSIIPYNRSHRETVYFRHLGLYAYRTGVLAEITKLAPSELELTEMLEQLRWLENGYYIAVGTTEFESPAVDIPEDLEKAEEYYSKLSNSIG